MERELTSKAGDPGSCDPERGTLISQCPSQILRIKRARQVNLFVSVHMERYPTPLKSEAQSLALHTVTSLYLRIYNHTAIKRCYRVKWRKKPNIKSEEINLSPSLVVLYLSMDLESKDLGLNLVPNSYLCDLSKSKSLQAPGPLRSLPTCYL